MTSNLFDETFSEDMLWKAYKKASRGSLRYKKDCLLFARNEVLNIRKLRDELFDGTYKFSGYKQFDVLEPKKRHISAPFFRDKIVQLCLVDSLSQIYVPKFINSSYACIKGRGTHKAVDKVQSNLRSAKDKWNNAYVLKLDVKKFFYTIDRAILKDIYKKVIKDERIISVVDKIIDSAEEISPKGLPLGNSLSQLLANVYMDRLDQYCKRYLGYKHYVRYADDVIICLPNKNEAVKAKNLCVAFLKEKLNLEANENKTQVSPVKNGVNAFGFKIWATHKLLRNDSKKKIKRKVKAFPRLLAEGKIKPIKVNQILASWSGHAKHGDTYNFIQKLLSQNRYLIYEKKTLKLAP